MHNRGYYRNSNGDLDPHAKKIAGKNHDMAKVLNRKESILNDGNPINSRYSMDITGTLGANTKWLNTNRKDTKLALREPLTIVPRDKIAHELRVQNFVLVTQENILPAPVKQSSIRLVA